MQSHEHLFPPYPHRYHRHRRGKRVHHQSFFLMVSCRFLNHPQRLRHSPVKRFGSLMHILMENYKPFHFLSHPIPLCLPAMSVRGCWRYPMAPLRPMLPLLKPSELPLQQELWARPAAVIRCPFLFHATGLFNPAAGSAGIAEEVR